MKAKCGIVIALTILFAAWLFWPVSCIVLENLVTQRVIFIQPMQSDDELTIGWVHSVEQLPWEEVFRTNGKYLIMDRTRFQSYGAGVPSESPGKTKMEEGWIVYYDLNQYMPDLIYSISKRGQHYLAFHRQKIALHEALPDAVPVRVSAQMLQRFRLLQLLLLPNLQSDNRN